MNGYSRIVVGSDGSALARDAVAVAGVLAMRMSLPVTAVTAWKSELAVPGARELPWAELTTQGADVDLSGAGVRGVVRVEANGDPAESLIEVATGDGDALLVVGAQGLSSATSRLTGSTSNQLSHNSPVDVLFVRKRIAAFESIALATDGSETSLRAVSRGYAFAAALGAGVTLVTVAASVSAGDELLEKVAAQLAVEHPELSVQRRAFTGSAADVLASDTGEYDVLVLGNRGMSGFARVLGSTANTITHRAATNLLLVNTTH